MDGGGEGGQAEAGPCPIPKGQEALDLVVHFPGHAGTQSPQRSPE